MIASDWAPDRGRGIRIQNSIPNFLNTNPLKLTNSRREQPGTTLGYRRRRKKSCTRFRDFRKILEILRFGSDFDGFGRFVDDFGRFWPSLCQRAMQNKKSPYPKSKIRIRDTENRFLYIRQAPKTAVPCAGIEF